MFQIKDGSLTLNTSRKLTPKQLTNLKRLESEHERTRYMLTLMGIIKGKCYIDRAKVSGRDLLASKPKDTFLKQMRRIRDVESDHYPTDKDLGQWVGVEIECIIPHQDGDGECNNDCDHENGECYSTPYWNEDEAHSWLRNKLERAGVNRVCIKHDGSLSDDDGHGVELTILFNSSHGFEPLIKLCKVLKDAGCYVNKTCGLHVHLDARHLTVKKVTAIGESIGNALPVLKWLVPESRHKNHYCELGVSGIRGERYYAVNLTAFRKYKTIEIRLHSGTINAEKITNWIQLLKLLGAAKLKEKIYSFQDLVDIPGVTDTLVEYMDKRITELNPTAWPKIGGYESSPWPQKVG